MKVIYMLLAAPAGARVTRVHLLYLLAQIRGLRQ